MNNIKQITLAKAIQALRDKDEVYLIIPLKGKTQAKLLKKATGFCILENEEPEIVEFHETRKEELREEKNEEPKEETSTETQAPDKKAPVKTKIDHGKI